MGVGFFFLPSKKLEPWGWIEGWRGRGFHGSFIGVRVLELEYKSHFGFISFFNQTMTFV
jgi:hypothetical protein